MEEKKNYYFLDTNFVRQVSHKNNEELVDWIIRLLFSPDQPPVVPIVTHASRMEAMGLTPPVFQYQIPKDEIKTKDFIKIFSSLKQSALTFYQAHPSLTTDNIRKKIDEQRQYTHPKIIDCGLFSTHIEVKEDELDLYRKELIDLLSVNAIHAFDFPQEIRADAHFFLIESLIAEQNEARNVCLLRSFRRLWDNRDTSTDHIRYTDQQITAFNEAMRLKPNADMVDLEIVHFMLFGFTDVNNAKHPVIGFTSDKYSQRLHKRLSAFKGMISGLKKLIRQRGDDTSMLNLTEGILAKMDQNKDQRALLLVSQINPF